MSVSAALGALIHSHPHQITSTFLCSIPISLPITTILLLSSQPINTQTQSMLSSVQATSTTPSTYIMSSPRSSISSQNTVTEIKASQVNVQEMPVRDSTKKSSRFSTLKSILNGDVHNKYDPRFAEERHRRAAKSLQEPRSASTSTSSTSSSTSSKSSTLKSIITGDVHKHNPMRSLERSIMAEQAASSPKSKKSTLRSILDGSVQQHNPRLVEHRYRSLVQNRI